jgi:hypothetical protein
VKKKLELCGIKHFDLNLVPPGDYIIRLIVRDKATGEIGCQTQEISVPDYDKGNLALSGPAFIQPLGAKRVSICLWTILIYWTTSPSFLKLFLPSTRHQKLSSTLRFTT